MIPTNKTFKYLANADIETDIDMALLPLTEDDAYGFKFRIDITEFADALDEILDPTDETSVAISLILDDNSRYKGSVLVRWVPGAGAGTSAKQKSK